MSQSITVVILAAGLGTRMRSKMAKVLHRAGGQTLVEHVIDTARSVAEPERILTVVGHQADRVREVLAPSGVRFVEQKQQRGTGHAVLSCRDDAPTDGLLAVLYGDAPLLSIETLQKLVAHQSASTAAATMLTTHLDDPTGYGRIIRAADGSVEAIVEQKAATPRQLLVKEINSGIYCFNAGLLWKHIGEIGTNNPAGEYYLTDIVEILRRHGHHVDAMPLRDPNELLGINTKSELADVDRIFRTAKVRQLMLDGVTIERPETVTIDLHTKVGVDTVIEPFARLLGRTVIGADCRVGACSIIENSHLDDGVTIEPFSSIDASRIGAGARIGPYARLRLHCDVGANAHIGNFVELKKTHMGEGAKANHLAYLGDAKIGKKTNIGAGTITCNYDGKHKHPTIIGENTFVGSNSTLVAPVELADRSYIAAGSVITEDVPSGALAIGRGRQVNKEGWVEKNRS
jgi:bifunctional UDP-N-acetylglucosamine pyrophosphorylase/glucosamine-1-phosphate N-acetyltransferase